MAIRVALNHVTTYRYDRPVDLAPHVVRLRPAPHCRTPIAAYSLTVAPAGHFLNWHQDPFGNHQARLVFPRPASELRLEVDLVAELTSINPFDFFLEEYAEKLPWPYEAGLRQELAPYLSFIPGGPRFDAFTERARGELARPGRRTIDELVDLNGAVHRALRYDIRMEPGVFTPEETLTRGHGSCRDFAWLLTQLCRRLGYAARFVSGYSIQLVADQKPLEGPAGVSADVTDLHAWAEIFLPGAGWVGFDATSGLACGEGHIPLSCTPDPGSAAPVTGSYGWSKRGSDDKVEETFRHAMSVKRLEDLPRATKPYDEASWRAILACGDEVEAQLERQDVRLTMGGEPTFVSVDDMESPEWTTAALGPAKAGIADQLLRKLGRRFAPGALLHHGQGKWYPGEPLPRWAYSCYFRHDGQPIWQNPALYADGQGPAATPDAAAAFGQALARRLAVDPAFLQAAHEDVFYYLWRERQLPVNVDPLDSRLEDEQERARLRRIFEQGLDRVVGYALPLRAVVGDGAGHRWQSAPWFLRAERLYLLPGDSPMGFRLPLDSLPWVAPADREVMHEQDPFAPREPLPSRRELGRPAPRAQGVGVPGGEQPPVRGESAASLVRTALCIEPRGGTLHMFMPPLPELEPYLALVAAIEETADELGQPLRFEGYHPPADPRLNRLQVTPDPGVIEVNIHPARSWRELVSNTTILYEEARSCRLGTEKFMVDGRHTGTGGGNHLVMGGARPEDSPLLRRPDLLRSLASYWLNHPSLSYLFSGLFIGPTSQAPRVDEARHDSLYELEIAFRQLQDNPAASGGSSPPWLVDRLFRNLFTDVTGNTHRTAFCVDKLFSPDSAAGRQGLLELRAFEMPPDARMSCAQQLLVRGLLAWFWREPYTRPPVRWGTSLNDRFMLPHYVKQDFGDVIEDLGRAGLPLDAAWFEPHYQFRFPLHGRAQVRDVEIELRHALEPWHVMGEETTGTGTARFVDSSVERVQVLVRGVTDGRHVIACNGRRVPLGGTGTREEMVAGVRYRAWQPPSALHPTIGVHSPLVFDVIDTWAGRSVGGCSYHVTHPGGRSYDNFPSNALEAESRRQSRFFPFGHTPGPMEEPRAEPNPELPHTLDLRRTVHK
jgi:uncharacterized protein (DUF2126 family)/transglutaminase-like putative cysteine protease